MTIYDKRVAALKRFRGKLVRRQFSTGRFSRCIGVDVHGPPSGWTCIYEIKLANRGSFLVERFNAVEIKVEKQDDSPVSSMSGL